MEEHQGTRINKYLSEIGFCSRRQADRMIEQRRVTINGKFPVSATKVTTKDKIRVDGNIVSGKTVSHIYLAFNKPVGIVTTTDTKGERNNIIDYINYPTRIFPVGRLDKESEGLIFMTSDGDIVNKILRAGNKHEKEYQVTVNKPVTEDFINQLAGGIPILGTITKKCTVRKTSGMSFEIILTQGLNRQIRRMCEHLGYAVKKLKRTRIMNIKLDVPPGQWRELTADEMEQIKQMLAASSKTQKKANKKSTPPKKNFSRPFKKSGKVGTASKRKRAGSKPVKKGRPSSGKNKSGSGRRGRS